MSEPGCHFCERLAGLDRLAVAEVVWRFPRSVALLGTWQFYHGYCVLVSRTHARELFALPDDERRGYLDEMCLLARAIDAAFRPHKLNYELLGNQVPHLHWHLFPRYADDPARLSPVWLALDAADRDEGRRKGLETGRESRAATAARLRQALASLGAPTA
jgi:diadenosine tetraphosphate (Ap4A) HIT family hydrolase